MAIIIKPFFYASSVASSVPLPVGLSQLLGDSLELFSGFYPGQNEQYRLF